MNARKLPEPSGLRGWFGMGICIVYGVGMALVVIVLTMEIANLAPVILALSPLVIAFVFMAIVRKRLEPIYCDYWFKPGGMFSPRTQSWAFLFGNGIFLPAALGMAGMSSGMDWVSRHNDLWFVLSMVFGIVVSTAFRLKEIWVYTKYNHEERLGSPTKLWHDGVVYTSLAMLLVYFGIPAVWRDFSGYGWIVLTSVGLWVVMCVADMIRKPLPADMHPRKRLTELG